jgi:hypothetical protein
MVLKTNKINSIKTMDLFLMCQNMHQQHIIFVLIFLNVHTFACIAMLHDILHFYHDEDVPIRIEFSRLKGGTIVYN